MDSRESDRYLLIIYCIIVVKIVTLYYRITQFQKFGSISLEEEYH